MVSIIRIDSHIIDTENAIDPVGFVGLGVNSLGYSWGVVHRSRCWLS